MKTTMVIVDTAQGGVSYCVSGYEYNDGALVLHLADEDSGDDIGLVTYPPGAVRLTTEWRDDEDEDEGEEQCVLDEAVPAPASQTFKVGKTTVSVRQLDDSEGIEIRDIDHDWYLLKLRLDGVWLYPGIGDSTEFKLEAHDGTSGYVKTRWDI